MPTTTVTAGVGKEDDRREEDVGGAGGGKERGRGQFEERKEKGRRKGDEGETDG